MKGSARSRFFDQDVEGVPHFIERDLDLSALDLNNRSSAFPVLSEDFGQFVHQDQGLPDLRVFREQLRALGGGVSIQEVIHCGVSQSFFAFYHAFVTFVPHEAAVRVYFHLQRERQPRPVLYQRTNPVGQREGQHRDDRVEQVGAGTSSVSLAIELRIHRDVRGYVGDVDSQQVMAVVQLFDPDSVVEVFRGLFIDGENDLIPVVLSVFGIFREDAIGYTFSLFHNALGEVFGKRQPVFDDHSG